MKASSIAMAVIGTSMMGTAMAHDNHSCNVSLSQNLVVEQDMIRITDDKNGRTLVQISDDKQLFINGDLIELTSAQARDLNAYSKGIRDTLPEVVDLAMEGVDLGLTAVDEVFHSLTQSGTPAKLEQALEEIKASVSDKLGQQGDAYYFKAGEFDALEQSLNDLEPQIESAVLSSAGSILIALGQAMSEGEGSFEQKMQEFSAKMENLGDTLEAKIEAQAEGLEAQAIALCEHAKDLDKIESRLQASIPQLAEYDLIESE